MAKKMDYEDISKKLDEIEAEMKKHAINIPPNAAPQEVGSAFGGAEMAFEQWLALVFLPAARKAVATKKLPSRSQVGVAALRNFDGRDELDYLAELLSEFDRVTETVAKQEVTNRSS